jgi:syntaxin 16
VLETEEDHVLTRSTEVQNLAKSIAELSTLFKDLNMLVVEQGTVLDRIDYNIMQAKQHTTKANTHIEGALKYEQSGRSRKCIISLGVAIFICSVILMLRWTS